MNRIKKENLVIIGAGPAGLGCAYELINSEKSFKKFQVNILDKNDIVGGLARTYKYNGHFFDIGPHRFFTKNPEIINLWEKILKRNLLTVNRLTRIHYNNKIFYYPVQLKDIILKLGLKTDIEIFLSFLYSKLFLRNIKVVTFEQAIVKDFGYKLYSIFFKTYSEKVWGISCDKISAKWAAQRIKNLNLIEVVKTALLGQNARKAKSLVDKFLYPVEGAGLLYKKMDDIIKKNHGRTILNSSVIKIQHQKSIIRSIEYKRGRKIFKLNLDYLFSSMPLTDFVLALSPAPDKKIIQAARKLMYRDHITVNLVIDSVNLFPDNWIYVHSPDVQIARVTNYNNFVPKLKYKTTGIAVEYFAFKTDRIWKLSDQELIELAIFELEKIKLLKRNLVKKGFVIKEPDSYPAYYLGYEKSFNLLKDYIKKFNNLQLIGRGGMYKYNNQDHAIYSGILAARNYLSGSKKYDIWSINEDAEYLEEVKESS